jgi:formylglycine-generating enzyme
MKPLRLHAPFGICAVLAVFGLLLGCAPEAGPAKGRFDPARSSFAPALPVQGLSVTIKDLGLELQPIQAGKFLMGSAFDEPGRSVLEGPLTWVTISRPFWLGRTAVTHAQWRRIMGTDLREQAHRGVPLEANPDRLLAGLGDDVPVYFVNWNEAMAFCAKLNERARAEGSLPDGYEFRLPTEAEWEYAARAGTTEATYAGPLRLLGKNNAPLLDAIAWYAGNSSVGYRGQGWDTSSWVEKHYPGGNAGVRAVAQKAPNAWGLYDMLGNVHEWCLDFASPALAGGSVTDPSGPPRGLDHVIRGGSWHSDASACRAAFRTWNVTEARLPFIGFRLALAPILLEK